MKYIAGKEPELGCRYVCWLEFSKQIILRDKI